MSVYDRPSSNFDGFLEVCLEKMRPQTSRALLLVGGQNQGRPRSVDSDRAPTIDFQFEPRPRDWGAELEARVSRVDGDPRAIPPLVGSAPSPEIPDRRVKKRPGSISRDGT